MEGYIRIHRKLLINPIFQNEKLFRVFMWCLLKASYQPREVVLGLQKIPLQQGEFIFGRNSASKELVMKPSSVWKYVLWLKRNNYIDIKTTNKYSIITVCNWKKYQLNDNKSDNNVTTKEQQRDTNNKVNKVKNNILPNGNMVKDQYGNKYIEYVLETFKKHMGAYPIEDNKRNIAYNIYQITGTFIRKYGDKYQATRGTPATFSNLIDRGWSIYLKNNEGTTTRRLKTFKQHYKFMLEKAEGELKTYDKPS